MLPDLTISPVLPQVQERSRQGELYRPGVYQALLQDCPLSRGYRSWLPDSHRKSGT